ncbi:MAG: LysM domain-containing protein [Clostridia bacterium]|nr:LysM domain-containing protein [Clostridia bacterium]
MSLLNHNPYIDPSALEEGEVLIAPEREFCHSRYGDTPAIISERYGIPLFRLAALNPGLPAETVYPGSFIRLK